MSTLLEFLRNETALVSGVITAATGLLTGPVFDMDAAAVGSITAVVVVIFNTWVRFSVFSKKGAAKVATAAATEAVSSMSRNTVGTVGTVTAKGTEAVSDAVDSIMGTGEEVIKPPG